MHCVSYIIWSMVMLPEQFYLLLLLSALLLSINNTSMTTLRNFPLNHINAFLFCRVKLWWLKLKFMKWECYYAPAPVVFSCWLFILFYTQVYSQREKLTLLHF